MKKSTHALKLFLAAATSIFALTSTLWAQSTSVDFESVSPGLIRNELRPQGIWFPRSIEVFRCGGLAVCPSGHSGINAATALRAGEFVRDTFTANFLLGRRSVSLWVRYNLPRRTPTDVSVTLRARGQFGILDSTTIFFRSDASWQLISVRDPGFGGVATSRIVSIDLTGGPVGLPDNEIAVDDIVHVGRIAPVPPPDDDMRPAVQIESPGYGAVIREAHMTVGVRVEENIELRTVTGDIRSSGGAVVSAIPTFCGASSTGPCPSPPPSPIVYRGSQDVSLVDLVNGNYTLRIQACDGTGCTTASRPFVLDVPEPPPVVPVSVYRVEVNQGMQSSVDAMPRPGVLQRIRFSDVVTEGRDSVVRFYLFGEGASRPGYSAQLSVTYHRNDGTTRTERFAPNAGASSINVPVDPLDPGARLAALAEMRADLTTTLNYVIPGRKLRDVELIDLRLREAGRYITGRGQLVLASPIRLGLNVVRVTGPAVTGSLPTAATIQSNIVNYLDEALPVSEVRILSTRTLIVLDSVFRPIMGDCEYYLWQVWSVYGTGDAPVRSFTTDPSIIPTLGVVPNASMSGVLGCSHIGDPSDEDDRIGGTVITKALGDTAAHEIGHRMGLVHASNSHGEDGGGDWERWPYPHGTLHDRSFGMISTETLPRTSDYGQWQLNSIDPCPAGDPSQRFPECTFNLTNENVPHELMSYGFSTTDMTPLVTSKGRWPSSRTFTHFSTAIFYGSAAASAGGVATDSNRASGGGDGGQEPTSREEAFLVQALLRKDGSVELLPILRKQVPRSALEEQSKGPYSIQLYDRVGNLRVDRSLVPVRTADGDLRYDLIREVLPFFEGLGRVSISKDGVSIFDDYASRHAPEVRIVSPNGGEILTSGVHPILWEASDEDGDALSFLVQYSPDGGESWQGIAILPAGNPNKAELRVGELTPSQSGRIRVTASDGMNTSIDWSDCGFSLGTQKPPICGDDRKTLSVDNASVSLRGGGKDTFYVSGSIDWSRVLDSDPTLPGPVVVELGGFAQTIPAEAFVPRGQSGFLYTSRAPGIAAMLIREDGVFRIRARYLDLSGLVLEEPVPFAISIGNQRGEALLRLDEKGRLQP